MSVLDPGRTTPTREPYAGDEHAQRIRAALEQLRPEHRVAKQRTREEHDAAEGAKYRRANRAHREARLAGLPRLPDLPGDLVALSADDPLVSALAARINTSGHLIMSRTIGAVVAALREIRPEGVYDRDDEALLDAAARRIGYPGPGSIRLSIVRHVIDALNAEHAAVPRG